MNEPTPPPERPAESPAHRRSPKFPARFRLNVISGYVRTVIASLTSLVTIPVLANGLGKQAYGVWVIVDSFAAYREILQLGFAKATPKYVAEYLATGRHERVRAAIATSFWILAVPGLVALVAGAAVAAVFPSLFDLEGTLATRGPGRGPDRHRQRRALDALRRLRRHPDRPPALRHPQLDPDRRAPGPGRGDDRRDGRRRRTRRPRDRRRRSQPGRPAVAIPDHPPSHPRPQNRSAPCRPDPDPTVREAVGLVRGDRRLEHPARPRSTRSWSASCSASGPPRSTRWEPSWPPR